MTDLRQRIDAHLRGDIRRESPLFPYKDWVTMADRHGISCVGVDETLAQVPGPGPEV